MDTKYAKTVVERYCPVVGHNVAVEVSHMRSDDNSGSCLNAPHCDKERGGCSNSFFQPGPRRG